MEHRLIESLVGHPYVEPFGCFVVVAKALELLGKPVPDYTEGLTEAERLVAIRDGLARHAVEVADPERGDLVLLRVMGEPCHIGIMVSRKEMLHCTAGTNAVIERIDSLRWRGRVVGFWRP